MSNSYAWAVERVPGQYDSDFIRSSGILKLYEDRFRSILGIRGSHDGWMLQEITGRAEKHIQTERLGSDEFIVLSRRVSLFEKDGAPQKSRHQQETHTRNGEIDTAETAEPAVELANGLLHEAVLQEASDVHIEPDGGYIRVRFRVHGVLVTGRRLDPVVGPSLTARFKVMAGANVLESALPQEGHFSVTARNREIHARISFLPGASGESMAIRLLRVGDSPRTLQDLGFSRRCEEGLLDAVARGRGLLLVSGPTGSGKTTTMYALLDALTREERKVVTIEDPVERHLLGTVQIPVKSELGFGFARLARMVLRHDPDIMAIGEIRDEESAEVAVRAALTGHLVIASIHTADAAETIPRLIDMGIPAYLLAVVLNGVLAQRLIRTNCTRCLGLRRAPEWEISLLHGNGCEEIHLTESRGCEECTGTGYGGRTAIGEFLCVDTSVTKIIREGPITAELELSLRTAVSRTLAEDGLDRVAAGTTTISELMRALPDAFHTLRRINSKLPVTKEGPSHE
jgi:type II secretory ATPase GspE/PulE/Tfp pilus assembly ATPase PilB-like protein